MKRVLTRPAASIIAILITASLTLGLAALFLTPFPPYARASEPEPAGGGVESDPDDGNIEDEGECAIYSASDVAAINDIIISNNLEWDVAVAESGIPESWNEGIIWDDGAGGEKRVVCLIINFKELTGSLDVSALEMLEELHCNNNNLTFINASGLAMLLEMHCNDNILTSVDVTGCAALGSLDCRHNQMIDESAVIGFTGVWDDEQYKFTPQSIAEPDPDALTVTIMSYTVRPGLLGAAVTEFSVADGVSGGTPPYTFSMVSGPRWLDVSESGAVSGTRPTDKQEETEAVVRVVDSAEPAASAEITISVGAVLSAEDFEELIFEHMTEYTIPAGDLNAEIKPFDVSGSVSGGVTPYTFTKTKGPDWLKVSESGTVSGMRPSTMQKATTAIIKVTDSADPPATDSIEILILTVGQLAFTYSSYFDIPPGRYDTAVEIDLSEGVAGGTRPYTFQKVSGPSWIIVNPAGRIYGTRPDTPQAATSLEIILRDSTKPIADTKLISLSVGAVSANALTFEFKTMYNIPEGDAGASIKATNISDGVSGGTRPYKYRIESGPSWLKIGTLGVLSGTRPDTAQSETTAVIIVTDSSSPPATAAITIKIGAVNGKGVRFARSPSFDVKSGEAGAVISPINFSGAISGGQAPYIFSLEEGPGWLRVSSDGVMSGQRSASMHPETTATIRVEDSATPPTTAAIMIRIGAVKASAVHPLINPFTDDVCEDDWFYNDVVYAYSLGLINGKSETRFSPNDNLTYAEAVKLAACMHQKYTTGVIVATGSDPWYMDYAEYARKHGIIDADQEWDAPVTRSMYMEVFSRALPDEAFSETNIVSDGMIPDVDTSHPNVEAIYKLYRTGVVQGRDEATRKCDPGGNISRAEVAAILTRMIDSDTRIRFSMEDVSPEDSGTDNSGYEDEDVGDREDYDDIDDFDGRIYSGWV